MPSTIDEIQTVWDTMDQDEKAMIQALSEATEVILRCNAQFRLLTECSGEVIHANDIKPEFELCSAWLTKWGTK
jgi:hypothetical protein